MIKLVVEINRHESRIIEETLFELAPHNWTIHFNRRNKSHRIEGVFRSESLASKAANELNNFLDFKNLIKKIYIIKKVIKLLKKLRLKILNKVIGRIDNIIRIIFDDTNENFLINI